MVVPRKTRQNKTLGGGQGGGGGGGGGRGGAGGAGGAGGTGGGQPPIRIQKSGGGEGEGEGKCRRQFRSRDALSNKKNMYNKHGE